MNIEDIARICHEANRAYCQTIGDVVAPPWDEASAEQKAATIAAVNFSINEPDARVSDFHVRWKERKEAEGWKLGPEKNAESKQHPWLMPFDSLPRPQQAKGKLFLAISRVMRFAKGQSSGFVPTSSHHNGEPAI